MIKYIKITGICAVVLAHLGALGFLTLKAIDYTLGNASGWWGIGYIGFLLYIMPLWVWLRSEGPLKS